MPYISQEDRKRLLAQPTALRSVGELNFVITTIVNAYLYLIPGGVPNYERYNAAIGALECAKLELYARKIRSYEDRKILANGDVLADHAG